jgi:hypothetical protein
MIQGTFCVIQGTFCVIQGTFGVIQGTFGVIQGTFGVIQGTIAVNQGKFGTIQNSKQSDSIEKETRSRVVYGAVVVRLHKDQLKTQNGITR